MVLVLLVGIVLAIDSDTFELWDFWVLAAIVLWLLLGFVGQRTGAYYTEVQSSPRAAPPTRNARSARLRAPTGALWHLGALAVFVLLLLDMIFKPGA